MEDPSLKISGTEDFSSSDVNVYITIDPASLQKWKEKRKERSRYGTNCTRIFTDCMQELDSDIVVDCQFCVTRRGLLIIAEMVLALILLLIVAPSHPGYFGGGFPYVIVVNSINIVVCIAHLIYQFVAASFSEFTALRKAMICAAEFLLLLLQVISFIVVFIKMYPAAYVIIFLILTLVQCAFLIMSLILSYEDGALQTQQRVKPLTKSKRERLRRQKMGRKKYKRLHHSGF